MVIILIIVYVMFVVFLVYNVFWNNFQEIVLDYVVFGVDLLIGGGWKYFYKCMDCCNLIQEMKEENYVVLDFYIEIFEEMVFDFDKKFVYFIVEIDFKIVR